jgi:hypothetical protein
LGNGRHGRRHARQHQASLAHDFSLPTADLFSYIQGGKGYWIQTTDSVVLVFNVPEPAGLLLMLPVLFIVSGLRRRTE